MPKHLCMFVCVCVCAHAKVLVYPRSFKLLAGPVIIFGSSLLPLSLNLI